MLRRSIISEGHLLPSREELFIIVIPPTRNTTTSMAGILHLNRVLLSGFVVLICSYDRVRGDLTIPLWVVQRAHLRAWLSALFPFWRLGEPSPDTVMLLWSPPVGPAEARIFRDPDLYDEFGKRRFLLSDPGSSSLDKGLYSRTVFILFHCHSIQSKTRKTRAGLDFFGWQCNSL